MIKSFEIDSAKRIILKIGSSLLIENKKFNYNWLESFIDDVIILKENRNNNCSIWCSFSWRGLSKN